LFDRVLQIEQPLDVPMPVVVCSYGLKESLVKGDGRRLDPHHGSYQ